MSSGECSFEALKSQTNKCIYIQDNCPFEYINMLAFNYCVINDNKWLTFILLGFIIVLCFYYLSSTGNDYLAPTLGIISEKLHLSQNLAGLTLLALGNCAPDIIVAFVAGDDENEGVETSLGSLLGGGIIVVGLVLATCVLYGKEVPVIAGNFIRDLSIYLIALIYILILGAWSKKITIWQSCIFLVLYAVYVIVCFVMDKKGTDELEEKDRSLFLGEEKGLEYKVSLFSDNLSETPTIKSEVEKSEKEDEERQNKQTEENITNKEEDGIDINNIIKKSFFQKRSVYVPSKDKSSNTAIPVDVKMYSKFKYDLYRYYFNKETDWDNKNTFQRILFLILDFPFNLLRDATIPAYEDSKWKRTMFVIQPISISIFFIVIFSMYSFIIDYWQLTVAWLCIDCFLCLVFYKISYRTRLPSWHWPFLIAAFVISILWLWFLTNILMDMITTIKLMLPVNIPQSFLSMTIIACGNSLPDFIVNTSLAKTGYAEMAISGSIGAPVFGILFGFGISILRRLLVEYFSGGEGIAAFNLFNFKDENLNKYLLISGISCVCILLIGFMICGAIMKFNLKKCISFFGYCVYFLFFLSIIFFTFIFPNL